MWLSQLTLVNFRNIRALRLEPQPGVLLFCGQNGQGKTNLLESVYVLATTRSPRTSVERELLSWGTPEDADLAAVVPPFARLEARVRRLEGEVHLELTFEAERSSTNGAAPGAYDRTGSFTGWGILGVAFMTDKSNSDKSAVVSAVFRRQAASGFQSAEAR